MTNVVWNRWELHRWSRKEGGKIQDLHTLSNLHYPRCNKQIVSLKMPLRSMDSQESRTMSGRVFVCLKVEYMSCISIAAFVAL